jgi:protein-tyrosine phosphatase
MATDYSKDFNFITDRLAIGCLASRSTPGFVAVVSVVTVEGRHRGRPWSAELTARAPQVPGGVVWPSEWYAMYSRVLEKTRKSAHVPVLVIDIADGEASCAKTAYSSTHEDDRDLDFYLDDATDFIAEHIRRGCVLVHCGAGISRSAAVVIAYLCRFAGMSYAEALAFVKAKRPQVAPADVFKEAIERWLGLDKLATTGPRQ